VEPKGQAAQGKVMDVVAPASAASVAPSLPASSDSADRSRAVVTPASLGSRQSDPGSASAESAESEDASRSPGVTPDGTPQADQTSDLKLPILVFGIVEVRRLERELEALEDFIRQSSIREPGKQPALPRLSRLLDGLATDNNLNLLQPADRQKLVQFLQETEHHAPSIHISFATDPSSAFTAKVVAWLRGNIHPNMLLDIGLQPNIAAGCVVRSTNKLFDMSLRQRFADAHNLLIESLDQGGAKIATNSTPTYGGDLQAPTQTVAAATAQTAPSPDRTPQASTTAGAAA
jgi:F0F1-type ATP synthase delta subunit